MATEDDTPAPWLNRAWTQNILRDVEKDPSLSITDYHVKDMSSKGDQYLSEMHRITITVQRASDKKSKMFLISKKLPPGNGIQKKLCDSCIFPNEIKMFSQMLPKFQDILEDAAPERFKPFAARHIYSQDNIPYFLIVNDLATEGFKMATRQRGLDLDHCLLVMKTLGRYHAVSVALHDSDPHLIESFKENLDSEECSFEFVQDFSKSTLVSIAKIVRSWPDGGETMADKLLNISDTVCLLIRKQLSPEGNRLNVLSHGDLWVNNLLFNYNDVTGSVEDVRMVDFQQVIYSSCAIDLQYFIHTSPRDEVRVAHTEDMLREYHSELCSTLQLLGQAKNVITFQELMEEYERKGVYGFFMCMLALPIILADSENAVDLEAVLYGSDQSESSDNRAANKEFVKVLKRLLPLFEQKGYFGQLDESSTCVVNMASEHDTSTPWTDRVWIQKVLRDVEKDPSLSITDYDVKDMSSKGDHYLSEIHRITITVQRAGDKESKMSLIAKKLPPGKEMQKKLSTLSAFPNEIKMFRQILPKLQTILEDAAPRRFKPFAAKHIYSKNNFPFFLIVSDLAPEGFRMATRQQGLDLDHCLLVMRALGRYHAASVALHDSDPQLIESFKTNILTEESSTDILQSFVNPSLTSIAKMVRSWPDGETMANKLLNLGENYCERIREQISSTDNRLNVLIHGDMSLNNLLFKYNAITGRVEDVRIVDFQMGYYTSFAIDLQNFIGTSPRDEIRAVHTEDILREYHTELCSTLQLLGLTNKTITFQELLDEYEKKGVYGFLISLLCLPHFLEGSGNVVDVEAALSGGDVSHSSDTTASNKQLMDVMKRLLPMFQQKGYL